MAGAVAGSDPPRCYKQPHFIEACSDPTIGEGCCSGSSCSEAELACRWMRLRIWPGNDRS